ncbi:relaxase/mobilization nuclease domain-containing protein [Enterococcus cecorum]|uniref:relaxase/mobilization nuclease domain-containing protein n=1 Tax=Enterococcus cecorum TaxID=44008 RepID=UPI000643399C|nr:relaxase/mobilization nuclease domain-containing protein [Enterococcus cecorum]KLO74014.1 elongation factor GreAB [Enterococcus cecorum]
MVYTKHYQVHKMKHLNHLNDYVEDAAKTLVTNKERSDLDNLFQYVMNDNKTLNKQLVSGYLINDVYNAMDEFLATKELHDKKKGTYIVFDEKQNLLKLNQETMENVDGRGQRVLAHHLIQSFSPDDDLTPEQIHEIGRKTMLEFTGGEYEFVIATHVDKQHIHNHIVVNSTNTVTGKQMPWKIAKTKSGKNKDYTKELFEQISDKIASKYGAKIIEKSPKNCHKKYTMWQAESIFKSKIQSRLDFLIGHSHNWFDFLEKAKALNLEIDTSGKWTKYKLLDEPQIKWTRGRNLDKSNPEKYNETEIIKQLADNDIIFTLEEVIAAYDEKEIAAKDDFDYQLTIESWQIHHVTDKGIYLNVDYGLASRGQIFIGGYKVDGLENGDYQFYFKRKDTFYFISENEEKRRRYMNGETLMKQLTLYNGKVPLQKEPVIETIYQLVDAINFLAKHDITATQTGNMERKLEEALTEAKSRLKEIDQLIEIQTEQGKIIYQIEMTEDESEKQRLQNQLEDRGMQLLSIDKINSLIKATKQQRQFLYDTFNETVKDLEKYHELKYAALQGKENQKVEKWKSRNFYK